MKKIKLILLFAVSLLSVSAHSETGYQSGTIEYVRTTDKSQEAWAPPIFWFTLNGVTSAGNCPAWNGNVLFVADSEQAYSMVLAAYMSGKEVSVRFDDSHKTGTNFCIPINISLGNPPPLF
ncbi:MAG: hypothetical protein MK096_04020 [Oleiphilaceae bacterium]|nr:hypothetical protein [Oleiphilaceae bacterium]